MLLVLSLGVLGLGIRVGMLLAPRVERMADRAIRENPSLSSDVAPSEIHEDDHDRTA